MDGKNVKNMPSEAEQRVLLRLPKIALSLTCTAVLIVGFLLSYLSAVQSAFEKSGSFVIGVVLVFYFVLEKMEFRTGVPSNFFTAAGHVYARSEMALTITLWTVVGTLVSAFGSWLVTFLTKGGI
ncbi:hypothetical protein [Thioclava atlantica]|uniref:Uncharacterized protein n=1 Tax=Thioclava atlantica TaxID=1317124 RepID=A0A085TSU4_9RHOB|nr:hypothetical protein [Thioclava atlantica]KFE33791.1 hypothetical protein DW2_16225 [Thioclava atlantica]